MEALEKHHPWIALTILVLSAFLVFWRLGSTELISWDEAYYGSLAIGTIESGDPINYYYGGQPDKWNAKPPLYVWLLAGVFSIFGPSVGSLRLISALSVILFFQLAFHLIRQYRGAVLAGMCCLALMAGKGILGEHVGRTGDTDALQLLLITGFFWFFLRWVDQDKSNAIWGAAICIVLAFWNKSVTAFFPLPAAFLYLSVRKKWKPTLKDWRFYAATLGGLALMALWLVISSVWGLEFSNSDYGSNLSEVMFKHDIMSRYDHNAEESKMHWDFFIVYLDTKWNIWHFVFFLSIGLGVYQWIQSRKKEQVKNWRDQPNLLLFSILAFLPLALILTFSKTNFGWYMAPYLLFVVIFTFDLLYPFFEKYNWVKIVWTLLLLFTLGRHGWHLHTRPAEVNPFQAQTELIENATQIHVLGELEPNDLFRLQILHPQAKIHYLPETWNQLPQDHLFLIDENFTPLPLPGFKEIKKQNNFHWLLVTSG